MACEWDMKAAGFGGALWGMCWKEGMVFVNMPVSYVKYFLSSKLMKYIYWSVENGFLYFAC